VSHPISAVAAVDDHTTPTTLHAKKEDDTSRSVPSSPHSVDYTSRMSFTTTTSGSPPPLLPRLPLSSSPPRRAKPSLHHLFMSSPPTRRRGRPRKYARPVASLSLSSTSPNSSTTTPSDSLRCTVCQEPILLSSTESVQVLDWIERNNTHTLAKQCEEVVVSTFSFLWCVCLVCLVYV
jgi:hypothetical protein